MGRLLIQYWCIQAGYLGGNTSQKPIAGSHESNGEVKKEAALLIDFVHTSYSPLIFIALSPRCRKVKTVMYCEDFGFLVSAFYTYN